MSAHDAPLTVARARLAGTRGRQYWRSLEEAAESPAFQAYLHREFPANASEWLDPVGRRSFLKLMSASLALAGVTACTVQPDELIVPYVRQPEEHIPGKPLFFATAMTLGGVATGLLVESHDGRPTKVEGNPDHPGGRGATDLYAQASVLQLYDPDRSQNITDLGEVRPWSAFVSAVRAAVAAQAGTRGAGLRILTETVSSPTLAWQIDRILARYPLARWIQWDPLSADAARAGARLAFGEPVQPLCDLTKADIIVSLDADFLAAEGALNLHYARQFASRRRLDGDKARMSRLYVAEATMTVTGSKADHRLAMKSSQVEAFARALAAGVGVPGVSAPAPAGFEAYVAAVAGDLRAHRGRSIVMAGDGQPPAVHAMAAAINDVLGNAGETVAYLPAPEAAPADRLAALRDLVTDMDAGRVQALLVLGESNPALTAPADLKFADAMNRVALRLHSGLYRDETAERCQWHVPAAHFLEAWSDARTFDGTASIVQPLIRPLYGGRSAHEILATLSERPERAGYDIVREYWAAQAVATEPFDTGWRRWLHDGVIPGTTAAPRAVTLAADWAVRAPQGVAVAGIEVNFRRDPTVYDGRFANNAWLQELPKPLTKLTWDNAALLAPATAERLRVSNGDVVEIVHDGRRLRVPVWVAPGQAVETITLSVGYGRWRAGRVGNGTGFDAYALQGSAAPWFGVADVARTGDTYRLVSTQDHWALEGRNIVRSATLEEYRANPAFPREMEHLTLDAPISLYPDRTYEGRAWGMAIDLNTCTGCSACVVACQSENNIPVVGKAQVATNREMHWLRIDRYYSGDPDRPDVYFQPTPCMHCENAPCEVVCPVSATVHSDEGLNDMVYNRCVGTRYCSNNCPYKVRRFNFLLYQDWDTPALAMQRNPDVTVRSRGVMEKCTYCVQRINAARIQAKREDREICDGEIATACEAACPTGAIVFGDLNDPASRVARIKADGRSYATLAELNTRPRTTYLAAVRNPHPDLPVNAPVGGHGVSGADDASERH